METIRNYLENMFMNLPKTKEVIKAKMELGQMMEDKYNELLKDGKTDNEAIGIVISEFGNLDELAEDLGIHDYMKQGEYSQRKTLSMDTVRKYISEKIKSSVHIALGVLLCITSPVMFIVAEALGDGYYMNPEVAEALGVFCFFAFIAAAVGMFIFDSIKMGKWSYLHKEDLQMDFATEDYVREQQENYRPTHALYITLGVVLCIFSVVPAAVLDSLTHGSRLTDNLSGAFVLILVAIGVMFFIMGAMRKGCYEELLKINRTPIRGKMTEKEKRQSRREKDILSVYWPTVTCVYLIWSFLSMDWWITWIIWPLAAVFAQVIKLVCRDDEE